METKYTDLKFKKDKIAFIKDKVGTNQQWAIKGLLRIFEFQTASEQATESTNEDNGVGFSGVDAEILTSFAKQISKGRNMSPKQMAIIHKKMPKYARQLMNIAEEDRMRPWNILKTPTLTH